MFDLGVLRKAVAGLGDQLAALRREIAGLQAEREAVAGAAPTKAEIKQTYVAFLRQMSLGYERAMAVKLAPLLKKPGMLDDPTRVNPLLSPLLGANRPDEMPSVGAMDQCLAFTLGPMLEKAMSNIIDAMNFTEGLPADKRARKLKSLDDAIEQLLAQEAELLESARSAGLNLEDA
jgi:hypothetical protein